MGFNQLVLCAAEKAAEFLGYARIEGTPELNNPGNNEEKRYFLRDFIGYHRFQQLIHTIHRRIILPELLCTRSVSTTSRTKNTVAILTRRRLGVQLLCTY